LVKAAALAMAALWAGCSTQYGSHDIELTIQAASIAPQVRALALSARGAKAAGMSFTLGRPMKATERMVVHVTSDRGAVELGAIARDGGGAIVGAGRSMVTLDGNGAKSALITLMPPSGLDGGVPYVVGLVPSEWTLFPGQSLILTPDSNAQLSVTEGVAGGTVDGNGKYTAPMTPGTYHVVATSQDYFGETATATIYVLANGVSLVGGRMGGPGYQDGSGSDARIGPLGGMATDGSSLYFVSGDDTFRKLDVASGTVSTVAGSLNNGMFSDGTGAAAHFSQPRGLALDGKGNAYVGDGSSVRRVVLATGQVTTFAGSVMQGNLDGVGANAHLGTVASLAYDGVNTLYFIDSQYCNVRRIDIPSQTVTVLAGTPSGATTSSCSDLDGTGTAARFSNLISLALDGNNLWISESSNGGLLRKMVIGSNIVSSVGGMIYGNTLAYDGHGGLWISNGNLTRLDVASGQRDTPIAPLQGTGSGVGPFAIAPDGTFYLGGNGTLYHYALMGALTRLAGVELRFLPYVAPTTPPTPVPLTQAWASYGNSVAAGADGTIYLGNYQQLLRVDLTAATLTTIPLMLPASVFGTPSLALDSSGNLVGLLDGAVVRIGTDGVVTLLAGAFNSYGFTDANGAAARFTSSGPVAADAAGNIYVGDSYNCAVRKLAPNGDVTTLAGAPPSARACGNMEGAGTAARLGDITALAYDGLGALYVGDLYNHKIWQVSIPAGVVTALAGSGTVGSSDGAPTTAQFNSPNGLVVDAARANLYVADTYNNTLRKVALANGTVSTVAGVNGLAFDRLGALPAPLNQPAGLARLPTGDLLVVTPPEQALLEIRLP
jgi:sugar lactone lactonase YvrE